MALTEGTYAGEFLLSEAPGTLSRDNVTVTVPLSDTLVSGQILGKITATGKYARYDDTLTNGLENAAGILYAPLVNAAVSAADFDGVIINFGAEVRSDDLEWDDKTEATGTVELLALRIKLR